MWGFSLQFWQSVFFWATVVAAVSGGIGISAAFVSAMVGYQISDIVQADADERIAEATARGEEARAEAGKAHERAAALEKEAAEARVEQERIKVRLASRRLTAEQYKILTGVLRGHPMDIVLSFAQGDPEARLYADDIGKVLFLDATEPKLSSVFSTQVMLGLKVHPRSDKDDDAALVITAFKEAGIAVELSSTAPFLTFEVGSKPPPF